VLEQTGFPVVSESRNGTTFWHFMEGFHVEALVSLPPTEQMALYFRKGLFPPLRGSPVYDALQSALQKIGAALPPQSFTLLRGLNDSISIHSFGLKDYSRSREVIQILTRAVLPKFPTRIKHRAVGFERGIEREVDPYRLWYVNNGRYLVANDHRSGELRVFAVERISSAQAPNRRFAIQPGCDFEEFSQSAFNLVWGDPQEVKIRFSRQQAPYIEERIWHPSQRITRHADGSIEFSVRVADLWEVKHWLIGFGSDAAVLCPEKLRKDIEQECAGILARKGKNDHDKIRPHLPPSSLRKR
jgi:predicted DNA-binding transcriptional regulator YafY